MKGYIADIEHLTKDNASFRHVLYSGDHLQLVLMSLKPGEEIGGEIHSDTDQFFRIENGKGRIVIDGASHKLKSGDIAIVPAGAHHNLICCGNKPLSLYTIYGPPHHMDRLEQPTKAQADASTESFDGVPSEHQSPALLL